MLRKRSRLKIICFDRSSIDISFYQESYYQQLASQIKLMANGGFVNFIGFSIGTHIALEVSAFLNDEIINIHLISAAAPIKADDFIDNMAGRFIFKLAMERPLLFRLLTKYQGMMALLAPRILLNMLFAGSKGKDKELIKLRYFRNYITPMLRSFFHNRANGYMRDINLYVTWEGNLSRHTSRVHLWHGTEDNWCPISMASYLCHEIPGATCVEVMEGLSHYSCLFSAAPKVCAQLEKI